MIKELFPGDDDMVNRIEEIKTQTIQKFKRGKLNNSTTSLNNMDKTTMMSSVKQKSSVDAEGKEDDKEQGFSTNNDTKNDEKENNKAKKKEKADKDKSNEIKEKEGIVNPN